MRFKKIFTLFRSRFSRQKKGVRLPAELLSFSRIIDFPISQPHIFLEALRHRSILQLVSPSTQTFSNERLEFLGDSILNLIVGEYLYHQNPNDEEGELTVQRSRLVNKKALTIYAKQIRLYDFLKVNPSLMINAERGLDTIVADAFEAVIAAIYLDGGYEKAKKFVILQMQEAMKRGTLETTDANYKSQLLEFSQAQNRGIPTYSVISEEGPDHDRMFTIGVMLNAQTLGTGRGKSKKVAEQNAAEDALKKITSNEIELKSSS
ncbi:MAG: ribonuclease III [Ignavibacteriales bacterium]|nr:ribonuclease III [Ignavibacteriales bacterium]